MRISVVDEADWYIAEPNLLSGGDAVHPIEYYEAPRVNNNGVNEDTVPRHLRHELEHLLGDYLLVDVESSELLEGDLKVDQGGLQLKAEASIPQTTSLLEEVGSANWLGFVLQAVIPHQLSLDAVIKLFPEETRGRKKDSYPQILVKMTGNKSDNTYVSLIVTYFGRIISTREVLKVGTVRVCCRYPSDDLNYSNRKLNVYKFFIAEHSNKTTKIRYANIVSITLLFSKT